MRNKHDMQDAPADIFSFRVSSSENPNPTTYRIIVGKKMVARKFTLATGDFEEQRTTYKKINGMVEKSVKCVKVKAKMQKQKLVLSETIAELLSMIYKRDLYSVLCTKNNMVVNAENGIEEILNIIEMRSRTVPAAKIPNINVPDVTVQNTSRKTRGRDVATMNYLKSIGDIASQSLISEQLLKNVTDIVDKGAQKDNMTELLSILDDTKKEKDVK